MSLFLNKNTIYDHLEVDPQRVKMAEIQYEAMQTTFNTLIRTCRTKCIAEEYGEIDLSKGESSCVDRCVAKFMKANVQIGFLAHAAGLEPNSLRVHQGIVETYCSDAPKEDGINK
ncbi:TIM22 complex subunit [Komagataella phaffii CBS 7435]|uniref:Mitochondrial import inner membrane translocase subunit n=2 Tax=Komagataella phaffii TaxID=460519 RepID=C4QW11_KOMPG|nr:Essential protein of the inner mitochondrial membrane, peripherally localized [Komagataella phaffii GS115]AOA60642.1 GQ67_02641T0 [Komagataella phaffii]CAH2446099.1 TIM22 complex subunit [Komagataella phaffii CBS 7435]AOA66155.1 GQ68_02607T0 [Komagataella phaffii GS115]CAY67434.1 Essential protein of the inner mitochondrial membrane, peripherally localized [Komagataella phaffii GS115]CCA36533.1 TIM22 complex subunit [Komagataella phaffii CBS 7435]